MRSPIFKTISWAIAILTVLSQTYVLALDNGLAITPQMGWNTYYHYGCNFNEQIVVDVANAMISNNLTALGYNHVLLDDCWQASARDPDTGAPVEDPNKFPNGMKALADKIHGLGLKFGIYSDAGTYTCGRSFGSLGYEEIDARTYASWGVDYLKYDNCYNEGLAGTPKISYDRFASMSRALNATGRPILYSMCNWGEDGPWNFAVDIANSWRISGDLVDEFDRFDDRCPCTDILDCKLPGFHCAMARVLDFAAPVGQKAGEGRWNDLDILQVGLGGMSFDEYVTHFTMWSLLKSPLIIGTDIMNMSNETRTILTNEALIAVNQDSAGNPANRIWKRSVEAGGNLQLWQASLVNNQFVFSVVNTSPKAQTVDVQFADVFIDQAYQQQPYVLYDLWQKDENGNWGKSLGTFQGSVPHVRLDTHQTKVWKAIPVSSSRRSYGDL
ncbi:alpha-galactosidase [Trametes meyenii]|nr:alpha-galactosidase [Trametes meyenii]